MMAFYFCLLVLNALGLVLMCRDKHLARIHGFRVPEALLLTLALLGAAPGIWLGMYLFRHKTRKPLFFVGMPLILAVQLLLALALYQSGLWRI